jgi:hypothetical protein
MGQSGLLGMVEGQTERNTLQMNRKRISPARKVRQNPFNDIPTTEIEAEPF